MKDELFKKPYWLEDKKKKLPHSFAFEKIAGTFCFDEKVSAVFDNMAQRSIPGYLQTMSMIVELTMHHLFEKNNQKIFFYDLGCSTGNLSLLLQKRLMSINIFEKANLYGIDSSEFMISQAQKKYQSSTKNPKINVDFIKSNLIDFLKTSPPPADSIFLNYTLQFINPQLRTKVLKVIYDQLKPGGLFFLSEKVMEEQEGLTRFFEEQHLLFKKTQKYSDLEIAAKRESIENVLIPQSVEKYLKQLQSVGFEKASIMCKWYNFACIVAIK